MTRRGGLISADQQTLGGTPENLWTDAIQLFRRPRAASDTLGPVGAKQTIWPSTSSASFVQEIDQDYASETSERQGRLCEEKGAWGLFVVDRAPFPSPTTLTTIISNPTMSLGRTFTLNNGKTIPAVGFGTFATEGSVGEAYASVKTALETGYRWASSSATSSAPPLTRVKTSRLRVVLPE